MENTPKYKYSFEMYKEDLKAIENRLGDYNNLHIVAPYKGGLPLGVALANRLESPLSILDFQRYDGTSEHVEIIKDADINPAEIVYIVDDLVDEGVTMDMCVDYMREYYPHNEIRVLTIFGRKGYRGMYDYIHEHPNMWIDFEPWE